MSAKCWADIFTKVGAHTTNVRTHIWMDDWVESFANFGRNGTADFGTNRRTNISANARTNFRVANFWFANFWTNWNGGERIAAKNI